MAEWRSRIQVSSPALPQVIEHQPQPQAHEEKCLLVVFWDFLSSVFSKYLTHRIYYHIKQLLYATDFRLVVIQQ